MPTAPRVYRSPTWESGTKRPRALLTDNLTDDVLTQTSFTGSVILKVYDVSSATPETAIFDTNRTISGTVFNSIQPWNLPGPGFNFADAITSNEVAWEGGHTYRISYLLRHVTDGYYPVVFETRCEPLKSL